MLEKSGRIQSVVASAYNRIEIPNPIDMPMNKLNADGKYQSEKLVAELLSLRESIDRQLLIKDLGAARKAGLISPLHHFQRAFGSVSAALAAAGVGRKRYTRAEMIDLLRELYTRLGRPIRNVDIESIFLDGNGPSPVVIRKEFGGLFAACKAAGIGDPNWKKYTLEELSEQLRSLKKSLGRRPRDRDIIRASARGECASLSTFRRMFEPVPDDLRRLAGFARSGRRNYSDEEIIIALRQLTDELGRFPTAREINAANKAGRCPAAITIFKRMGKLSAIRNHLVDRRSIRSRDRSQ